MLATVHSGSLIGIESFPVCVEARLSDGKLPRFDLVGLPEAAVKEARVRVRSAMEVAGYALPAQSVVVNLSPGDLRKRGSGFDLAIAIVLLAASGSCAPNALDETLLVGELSLEGNLLPARGVLAHLRSAAARGLRAAIVPRANALEATLAIGIDVRVAGSLVEVVGALNGTLVLPTARAACEKMPAAPTAHSPDLAQVRGQQAARRALEIAAAGEHHIVLIGPPGAGKTMLARRLPGILPEPGPEEALDIATIAGAAGLAPPGGLGAVARPFRAPHHTASDIALVGGGDPVRPGEVTLSHGGVLFLDELPEFRRSAIESLRTTMESGVAAIARVRNRMTLPARPLVVGAMNPCPCGYSGDRYKLCACTAERITAYRARISDPLLDRFDLHVVLPPVRASELRVAELGEDSATVRKRVVAAREVARARRRRAGSAPADEIASLTATLDAKTQSLLDQAIDRLGLTARGWVKVLRVARTIADLDASDRIGAAHVAEALQYRILDRKNESAHHPLTIGART